MAYVISFSRLAFVVALSLTLTSCKDSLLYYAGKQGLHQGGLILKGEDFDKLLKDARTPEHIRHYIKLAQEILDFAEKELALNTGRSYRKLVRLERQWVTQIVVAAYPNELKPYLFEFPIVGKVPYKGFFEEEDAVREAKKLREKGLDVYQRPAPAFSSLGWFPDPLYTNMLRSDAYLIELLLHELVHLNFYFPSHADFNEAFATWYASELSPRFVAQSKVIKNREKTLENLKQYQRDDLAFMRFVRAVESYAKQAYAKGTERQKIFDRISQMANDSPHLSESFKKREWNNARILSLSTYYDMVEPISSFARRNNLNAQEFLKRVMEEGESIVPKVLKDFKRAE